MNISPTSLFADIPKELPLELCQTLFLNPTVRIERILSQNHHSPEQGWYDQPQTEWVMLLQGQARLSFADADPVDVKAGDYLLIPAHCKHRVDWTSNTPMCIWLAIHIFEHESSDCPSVGA
ncbi:MAG: cupin domain-containing protein [Methylomonas sp.]|nr:cupin domain-containing protein [Methylomonas sp.]